MQQLCSVDRPTYYVSYGLSLKQMKRSIQKANIWDKADVLGVQALEISFLLSLNLSANFKVPLNKLTRSIKRMFC